MRLTLGLLLTASTIFLTACSTDRITLSDTDPCAWVKPIEFSVETKNWLAGLEWPDTAYTDFNKVGTHNDKVRELCGAE